jgi:hypothetical protein
LGFISRVKQQKKLFVNHDILIVVLIAHAK